MVDHNDDDSFSDENTLEKTSVVPSDTFRLRIAQADQAPPCLVLLVGPPDQVGRQWPIQESDKIIGRSVNSNIYVDDRSVSKSHAKLTLSNGEVHLIDLESTNRTIVNSKMLEPLVGYKLTNNDQIKTGNVIFKFLEKGNIEAVSTQETFDRGLKDALTGINNKGALEAKGPEYFKKARLLGVPLSVVTFDIDYFKKVNDTYGHPAGDYVLKELANIVGESQIRENDFFARSGGEEFTVLLLGSPANQAIDVAERVRKTIESHHFEFEGVKMDITISSGVSCDTEADQDWTTIFDRADKSLYQSKQGGRNRVTFSG